MVEFFTSLG